MKKFNFIITFLPLMLFFSCNLLDNRIEVAKKYIENRDAEEGKLQNIKLIDFKKYNGEEFIRNGHSMYKLFYIATYEALENGTIFIQEDSTIFITKLYSDEEIASKLDCDKDGTYMYKSYAPIKRELKAHETFISKGSVILLKMENGWDAKIDYQ